MGVLILSALSGPAWFISDDGASRIPMPASEYKPKSWLARNAHEYGHWGEDGEWIVTHNKSNGLEHPRPPVSEELVEWFQNNSMGWGPTPAQKARQYEDEMKPHLYGRYHSERRSDRRWSAPLPRYPSYQGRELPRQPRMPVQPYDRRDGGS